MAFAIIIFIIAVIAYFLLYTNGLMWMHRKRAMFYIGSLKGNGASFSSCTGYTKRIIKFEDSRRYRLSMKTELTKGDVSVEILDSKKKLVIRLGSNSKSGSFHAEKGKRYYLVVRFKSATGKYELHWD